MRTAIPAALLLTLAACSSAPAVEEGQLDSPYTAAEIRAANPTGTEIRFRLTSGSGSAGVQILRFVTTDAEGASIESILASEDESRAIPSAGPVRSSWEELRGHAVFPAGTAVRTRADCVVPAGKFEGWLYTVLGPEEGEVSRYYFADGPAGPPVKLESMKDGERVLLMELLERRTPPR